MAKPQKNKDKKSKLLEAFSRSEQIAELYAKGVTESEALLNSPQDRPMDDAHINDLLDPQRNEAFEVKQKGPKAKPGRAKPARKTAKGKKR
jgi:hypothetical protein